MGTYLGLTGNRLGPHDAVKAGLVKKMVSSEQMPALYDALMNEDLSIDAFERVNQCLQRFSFVPATEEVSQIKPLIDVCFAHPTVEMIRESLQSANTVWAEAVDNTLAQKSPLSLKVTLAQLQKAKGLSLAQCLQIDYDVVSHFMHDYDFYEGVRALLIDKDKKPQWHPARLDLVSEERVQKYFERSHPGLEWV